jgi:hypothetical protein
MKKALRAGAAPMATDGQHEQAVQAALALLERSVRMRHRRLAVQRLNEAVALGARVPDAHWIYCREAAATSHDLALQTLFTRSAKASGVGRPHRPGVARHG